MANRIDERFFSSERLVGVRKAKGWSPAELAKECGFRGQSTISRLEEGKRKNPGSQILGRLSAALEISTDYLVGRRPDLDRCSFLEATAQLTLETFAREHRLSADEERTLQKIAERHSSPPTFVEAWANLHKSLAIVGLVPVKDPTEEGRLHQTRRRRHVHESRLT